VKQEVTMKLVRRIGLNGCVLAALLGVAGAAHAQATLNSYICGPLNAPGQYGPFDYRTITSEVRHRVEDYHFTTDVETLRHGASSAVGGDIDYTLRVFPNSPRALLAMSRLSSKLKSERPQGAKYATECYFERAMRFTPDDPMPHLIYASYLKDRQRKNEVMQQLDQATQLRGEPTGFDLDYNLGLLYYDVGAYDKSVVAARRAYALGAPLPALMKKLKAAGKWTEPGPVEKP
jgi:hypothetical protein